MAAKPWIGFAVKRAAGKSNLYVQDVAENGPADKAGLKAEDEILTIDGKKVPDMATFKNMFKSWTVGQRLEIYIGRDKNGQDNADKKTLSLVVGTKRREEVKDAPPLRTCADIEAILKDSAKMDKCNQVVFVEADDDMSGLVTKEEFSKTIGPWLERNLGKRIDKEELEDAFDHFDKDRTGYMKQSEMVPVTRRCLELFLQKHGGGSGTPAAKPTPAPNHNTGGVQAQPIHEPPKKKSWKEKCCPCLSKK